jgi:hypothetical protein
MQNEIYLRRATRSLIGLSRMQKGWRLTLQSRSIAKHLLFSSYRLANNFPSALIRQTVVRKKLMFAFLQASKSNSSLCQCWVLGSARRTIRPSFSSVIRAWKAGWPHFNPSYCPRIIA